jgi:hypothetical protein
MTIALVAFVLGSPAGHRLTGVTVDLGRPRSSPGFASGSVTVLTGVFHSLVIVDEVSVDGHAARGLRLG